MKKLILTFLFIFALMHFLQAADRRVTIDSVKVGSNILQIDFTVDGIIDQKVAEGLRQGLVSTIEYQIQLWEKRSGWINNLVTQQYVRLKVYFDNWENKFVIMSAEEKRLTSALETVREKCSRITNVEIIPIEKIKPGKKYFFTVKTILRPLSVENYQDIKNWLSGKAKNLDLKNIDDTEQQEKKLKGGLLKMFLALTGFGDRVISGQSDEFSISEKQVKWGN
ncbi:DUF4390 domain-containing protein [candidate division KSB1 bacterium]|nr:DUF4390 domain-containing protein [candidate division KSB1 bacterium]MBL7093951.1 DUF4390 domain-containing protein [candidate division KSB1 bacterium]